MSRGLDHAKYDSYQHSGIEWAGEIPSNWDLFPIRAIFHERREKNIGPKTDFILSVMKDRGVIPYDEKGNVGNKKSEKIENYKVVYPGDLVINKMNAIIGSLGISAYHGALSQVYIILYPRNFDRNDHRFLGYLFKIKPFQASLIKIGKGIMELRESIEFDEFKKLQLPLPPLSEQQRIANFLDQKTAEIDAAIAKKQRLIELLKEQKAILINQAVTKGLNPDAPMRDSGVEWIGEVPEHWVVKKLKYLSRIRYGLGQPPKEKDGGLQLIRATNVERGRIVSKDLMTVDPDDIPYERDPFLHEGDIIIVRSGAYTADSAIVTREYEGSIAGYDMVVKAKKIKSQFLAYTFLAKYILFDQLYLLRMRAAQPHLNVDELGETLVLVPPEDQQSALIAHLILLDEEYEKTIDRVQSEVELMTELKVTLISEAVTGKIKI